MIDYRTETFLAVCRNMNFSKAAEEMKMTQPGVSQHIRYLEKYYGSKLFDYKNKKLSLTDAGVLLRRALVTMKHDSDRLRDEISGGRSGRIQLRMGATLSIGEFYLAGRIAGYAGKCGDAQLELVIANTRKLLEALDGGTIDFAFVEGNFPKDEYDFITVCQEPFIAVCGAGYDTGEIGNLSDIMENRLIVREDGSGTKDVLLGYLEDHGYCVGDFRSVFTVNNFRVILQLLESGAGISFMYKTVAQEGIARGTLREIEIPGFSVTHEFNFIWRKDSLYGEDYKELYKELMK